eukprot:1476802-Pyramimonas_sp.AAC.1
MAAAASSVTTRIPGRLGGPSSRAALGDRLELHARPCNLHSGGTCRPRRRRPGEPRQLDSAPQPAAHAARPSELVRPRPSEPVEANPTPSCRTRRAG